MKDNKLYCCFSVPLKNYLVANGIEPELKAKNCNTNCTMWIFIKTENLNNLLQQWSLGKN